MSRETNDLRAVSGDTRFFYFFGGIWLAVGAGMLAAGVGLPQLLDSTTTDTAELPPWAFALIGLALATAGGGIIGWARRGAAHDRRLMQAGLGVDATVTDIVESPLKINRQTRWNVCYRYAFNGRELEGKSRALPGPQVADFKPGQRVRIKIDPKQPADSLFLGKPA